MERVKLSFGLACITIVVLLLLIVGLGKVVLFIADIVVPYSCNEMVYHQTVASPGGQFSAQIVTVRCDRPFNGLIAADDQHDTVFISKVRLRAIGATADDQHDTVFIFDEPPGAIRLSVAWASEQHLVIKRLCVDGILYRALSKWRSLWRPEPSVTISYHCLDHHSEQHDPAASQAFGVRNYNDPYKYTVPSRSGNCSEHHIEGIASPKGQFSVQIVVLGCGGATIGPDTEVRLRVAGAAPVHKGEIVIEFDDGPVEKKLSVSWASEKRLLIEYDCLNPGGVYGKRYRWRDVGISYRCVDH